jgi:type IV secretion system protein VirB2
MPLDDLSPRGLWRLPRNGIRFLGGFHGVLLSPPAQLFRGLVIAPVVCGGGGRMGVRGVDVQIRSIVMVALGHCVLHIPVSVLALSSGVSHLTIPSAGQSNTVQTAPCFASILAGLMDDRYQFAHGEPGAKKTLAGVAPGTGIAVLATNVLAWLWGVYPEP